jgi:hypothetical protein
MQEVSRICSKVVVTGMLAAFGIVGGAGSAIAYGASEQPLAQIEVSANCNNLDFPLCQPRPAGLGLGGVWLWIEIDAGGSADIAGAGCGHVRGEGGGASPIRGDVTWVRVTIPPGVFPYWTDPTNTYYLVTLPSGDAIPFPVTVGHYSFKPAPAVAFQLQVAP